MAGKVALLQSGQVWTDTDGEPIQAHGGSMLVHEGAYYWYGENKNGESWLPGCNAGWDGYRVEAVGISCYSSRDLIRWKNEGIVLPAVRDDPGHDLHTSRVIERPRMLYNRRTGKFVLWMHIDSMDYLYARVGIATADAPAGPFDYLGSMRPDGCDSRDMTVFQDTDGKAYLIYSSAWNSELHISPLTEDYLRPAGPMARAFVTNEKNKGPESPVVLKHGGRYYMITSRCTGWDPNPAEYAVAGSMTGPWRAAGNPCLGPGAETTFDSQGTFAFEVADKPGTFVFMADRWKKTDLRDSRYVWLPIRLEDGALSIAAD